MGLFVSVNKDIERWVAGGLIDRATADRLGMELANRPGRFGLGAVLGVFGAILLGAALLSFVAANWQEIPRLARVFLILVTIAAGYIGGAWREGRGDTVFSATLYLIAAIAYGGGIALVGQMYHLSGDMASAALVWSAATLAAGFLLLSGNLAAMAAIVGLTYVIAALSEASFHSAHYVWITPLIAAGAALIARLTHTRFGLHAATWLFLGMFVVLRIERDVEDLDLMFALAGTALFLAFAWFDDLVEKFTHFVHALQFYALLVALAGFAALQADSYGESMSLKIILGIAVICLSIAALALKGRENGQVRAIAYLAFAGQVLFLAFVTIGSIMDTALFFFLIGIFVIIIAFLVVQLEKRFNAPQTGEAS